MPRPGPTLDRLVLGLVVGAALGAVLVAISYMFIPAPLSPSLPQLPLVAFLVFMLLLLTLALTHPPILYCLRAIGVHGWLGSAIAGAVSFMLAPVLFALAWSRRVPPLDDLASPALLILLPIGAAAGLAIWRVAHWNIDARSNGGLDEGVG